MTQTVIGLRNQAAAPPTVGERMAGRGTNLGGG